MKRLKTYLAARSIEDVWAFHLEVMKDYGFDRVFYAYNAFATRPGGMVSPEDALFLTNYGQTYVDEYVYSGVYRHGPLMKWATRNVGATSWKTVWDEIQAEGLTDGLRRIAEVNKKHEIAVGFTVSLPVAMTNANAGFGLCARKGMTQEEADRIWTEHGDEIQTFCHVSHLCIMQLLASLKQQKLTDRQAEVLELVANGKSMQDIATILGRKIPTIEKHLRGARESLSVSTTAQAVRKASVLNQIFRSLPE